MPCEVIRPRDRKRRKPATWTPRVQNGCPADFIGRSEDVDRAPASNVTLRLGYGAATAPGVCRSREPLYGCTRSLGSADRAVDSDGPGFLDARTSSHAMMVQPRTGPPIPRM